MELKQTYHRFYYGKGKSFNRTLNGIETGYVVIQREYGTPF